MSPKARTIYFRGMGRVGGGGQFSVPNIFSPYFVSFPLGARGAAEFFPSIFQVSCAVFSRSIFQISYAGFFCLVIAQPPSLQE